MEKSKIEKYLYSFNNKIEHLRNRIIYPLNWIKTLHGNIKQTNMLDRKPIVVLNPYTMLSSWLLDIIVNGLLLAIVINSFSGWKGIHNLYLIPALGIVRYMVVDFIKEIRKAIIGE